MPRQISKKWLDFGVAVLSLLIVLGKIRRSTPPQDLHTIESHFSKVPVLVAGAVYGDASGGHFNKYHLLRRVGFGLCAIDGNEDLLWGPCGKMPVKT